MKKEIFLVCALLTVIFNGLAQNSPLPDIGKPMPDFILNNIRYYKANKAELNDFKGKWLFLDFWSYSCGACIESFPKIDKLQLEFYKDVQFVLVGMNDQKYTRGIEKVYDRIRKNKNLNIPAAFDSVLVPKWNITSVPHIYIVDPAGILRFITGGRDITAEKIKDLIDGKEVTFYPKNIDMPDFDVESVYNKDKLLFTSLLSKWNGESQNSGLYIDAYVHSPEYRAKGWSVAMIPLEELYNNAYWGRPFWVPYDTSLYGKVYAHPILEIRDESPFKYDYTFDVGKGTYNYYLKIPDEKINREFIMDEIQRSLKNVFGYDVSIENRKMPVWKLVAVPGAKEKLQSKTPGKRFFSGGNCITGFTVKNYSVREFLSLATANLPNSENLPFIDETGIDTDIDFTIDTDMTSYKSIQSVLQKNGLDLIKGEKEMKALVIRDGRPK